MLKKVGRKLSLFCYYLRTIWKLLKGRIFFFKKTADSIFKNEYFTSKLAYIYTEQFYFSI